MARFTRFSLIGFLLALLPASVLAQGRTLSLGMGTSRNVSQVLVAIINYMAGAIVFLATAMFIVGAFFITFSRGEADAVTKGKNFMINGIIGMAVVLGSYAILRTVFYFIYV